MECGEKKCTEGRRQKGEDILPFFFHEPDLVINKYLYEYWWKFVEMIVNKVCAALDMKRGIIRHELGFVIDECSSKFEFADKLRVTESSLC